MPAGKYKGVRNTITFPRELYEKITAIAGKEHRSISQQIVYLCQKQLEQLESESKTS